MTGARSVGAEMEPSHLFWQGIDLVAAIEYLGDLVHLAAAKDTRINDSARLHGVLDDRHRKVTDDPIRLGGDATLNAFPENAGWDFVALGKGHDQAFWTRFLQALAKIGPDMAVNIEHEDVDLGRSRASTPRGSSDPTPLRSRCGREGDGGEGPEVWR